jgi:hypothetical protein
MPYLSKITNTFFTTLINRLGVRPAPPEGFELINTVQPVSIVDADISLPAIVSTQLLGSANSAGIQTAQADGTVLADSGAMAAGDYLVYILAMGFDTAIFPRVALQRRDAANAVTVWQQQFVGSVASPLNVMMGAKIRLELNERIRVLQVGTFAAGCSSQANIWIGLT